MALILRTLRPPKRCFIEDCPPEILYKIFGYLDAYNLLSCMVVNKRWYRIVLNIARMTKWSNLAVNGLGDRGACFTKKSQLSWKHILINCGYWQNVKVARPHFAYQYNIPDIYKVNIYKGNIIVSSPKSVVYLDQETYSTIHFLKYHVTNYDENDYMFVSSKLEQQKLTVCHKPYPFSQWDWRLSAKFQAVLYKLFYSQCYIVTADNAVLYLTWIDETWKKSFLARFFGQGKIVDFTLFRDKVYAITDWGRVITVDRQAYKFIPILIYNMPRAAMVTMFKNTGVVISGEYENNGKIRLCRQGSRHWILICPNLSCTVVHNNILLLGYSTGKVQIFLANKIRKNKPKPEITFNIQKFVQKRILDDPEIVSMDVSESCGFHELFIATKYNLVQIMLVYPYALNKVMNKSPK